MKTRTKLLLTVTIALCIICCAIAGWIAIKVVAWARDLPNRIVIDEDAIAESIGSFVNHSYHHVLRDGDASTQLQVINEQLIPLIADNPEAANWIRDEFQDDIHRLSASDDPAVSSAALKLLSMIGADSEAQPPE